MVTLVVNQGYKIRDPARRRDAVAGETIDVSEKEARLLKALRRATDAPSAETRKAGPVKTGPVRNEPGASAAEPVQPLDTGSAEAIVPSRRGRYLRRDERAEDE